MADVLLATESDAMAFGITVSTTALRRASARVRAYVGQRLSVESDTITASGPLIQLPERPVAAVASVVDADAVELVEDDEWTLTGDLLTVPGRTDVLTVTYTHGQVLTEPQVEAVCSIAARLGAAVAPEVAAGVQQQSAGAFSQTFGWDSFKAQADLTEGERAILDRVFRTSTRRVPRLIVVGS